MKCPHCKKEIDLNKESSEKRELCLKIIKENPKINISQISKKLDMKRGTIRNYLNKLSIEGLIEHKRIESKAGRPTEFLIVGGTNL